VAYRIVITIIIIILDTVWWRSTITAGLAAIALYSDNHLQAGPGEVATPVL
jgi:hypothetical protein